MLKSIRIWRQKAQSQQTEEEDAGCYTDDPMGGHPEHPYVQMILRRLSLQHRNEESLYTLEEAKWQDTGKAKENPKTDDMLFTKEDLAKAGFVWAYDTPEGNSEFWIPSSTLSKEPLEER